jgi:hypothetical protein
VFEFQSAPGQQIATAKGTLWGAVNTVTYYTDHVRSGADDRKRQTKPVVHCTAGVAEGLRYWTA